MDAKSNTPIKSIAVGLAAAALALGGYVVGNSNSSSNSTASAAVPQTAAQAGGGFARNGGPPAGFGTQATGAAASKAKAAALTKYSGSAETVLKLNDGSYVVHVMTSSGEVHVLVSKDFKVTGVQQGLPGGGPPAASSGSTGSTTGTASTS